MSQSTRLKMLSRFKVMGGGGVVMGHSVYFVYGCTK